METKDINVTVNNVQVCSIHLDKEDPLSKLIIDKIIEYSMNRLIDGDINFDHLTIRVRIEDIVPIMRFDP